LNTLSISIRNHTFIGSSLTIPSFPFLPYWKEKDYQNARKGRGRGRKGSDLPLKGIGRRRKEGNSIALELIRAIVFLYHWIVKGISTMTAVKICVGNKCCIIQGGKQYGEQGGI